MTDWVFEKEKEATIKAWKTPYIGRAHHLLVQTIHTMNAERGDAAHANYVPIIQSSGTGKSRMVHEAAGLIFTLPLNIREWNTGWTFSYPPPDFRVHSFFLQKNGWAGYLSFFKALFVHTAEILRTQEVAKDVETLALTWRDYLDQNDGASREELYERVVADAQRDLDLALEGGRGRLENEVKQEAEKLVELIRSRTKQPIKDGEAVFMIYLDEAHVLADKSYNEWLERSYFDEFTAALDCLTTVPLFVVVVSAKPGLWSKQGPFVELPFDYLVDGQPIVIPKTMALDDFAKVSFMAKFGRPLWQAMRYIDYVAYGERLLSFAQEKLLGLYDPHNRIKDDVGEALRARFSILNMRLMLELAPSRAEARELENQLVERNLRIVYSIPVHHEYLYSGSPSEPLLAEAAARTMNRCLSDDSSLARAIIPARIDPIASSLLKLAEDGYIKEGNRRALVMRLLLTLAYDSAAKKCCIRDEKLVVYSRRVPVVDFLEALISEGFIEDVLNCRADNGGSGYTLREAFKNTYVRFTHFVENGLGSAIATDSAFACIARGMALQVYDRDGGIDAMIPIALEDTAPDKTSMSCILIRVQDEAASDTVDIDQAYINENGEPFFTEIDSRPYITIDMQFSPRTQPRRKQSAAKSDALSDASKTPPSPSEIAPGHNTSSKPVHPRYAIQIYGCSPSVYKVVQNKDVYTRLIGSDDPAAEHARQFPDALAAVHRYKPQFDRNKDCYDWIDMPALQQRSGKVDEVQVEEVTVGSSYV
ncbi:hypothetical protein AcW1_009841 [Taiwanofungus camphoratus]|nr:hypothetical protein AcV5_003322 [Antrodia cinnamomea]KAI0918220.1 hypothetical protein AcV7_007023 [Antrodia cinnamomea]KAI0946365.1 hypothetical protein AcW1_009841 [Antrodia cinnamomea]